MDKRNKIGPALMLEILYKKYPGRFDLPSETEIRQLVTRLVAKMKLNGTITLTPRGIQEPFKTILINIVHASNFVIAQSEALSWFKGAVQHIDSPGECPSDQKLKVYRNSTRSSPLPFFFARGGEDPVEKKYGCT